MRHQWIPIGGLVATIALSGYMAAQLSDTDGRRTDNRVQTIDTRQAPGSPSIPGTRLP